MKKNRFLQGVFISCSPENVQSIIFEVRRSLGYMSEGLSAEIDFFSKAHNDFKINFESKLK